MIFNLDHTDTFPDPRYGNPDGFYAVGGEITPERLAKCYPMGIFPYFSFRHEPIIWWAPQERFVIHTDEIHVSHSMRNMDLVSMDDESFLRGPPYYRFMPE